VHVQASSVTFTACAKCLILNDFSGKYALHIDSKLLISLKIFLVNPVAGYLFADTVQKSAI
jgi:hypothetical protein